MSWHVRVSPWMNLQDIAARAMVLRVYTDDQIIENKIAISKLEDQSAVNIKSLEDAKARNAWLSIFHHLVETAATR